jgi:PAS domain S-box-containing protein
LFNMSEADFQLHGIRDPRLAVHATSAMPAWVWSLDGARVLWANAAGARLFGARNAAILAERTIGPADPHRRQAAQLAARLSPSSPARLERLRGFGAPLGRLLTCSCARLVFADGSGGLLIAAAEPAGRPMPLTDRLTSLVESIAMPAMIFTPNGALAGVNEPAKCFAALLSDLTGPGFDDARSGALRDGQSVMQMDLGRVTVHRVGSADATALVALIGAVIVPKPIPKPVPVVIAPDAGTTTISEPVAEQAAPAAETVTVSAVEAVPAEAASEPIADVPHEDMMRERSMEQSGDVMPVDVFESVFDEAPAQDSAVQEFSGTTIPPEELAQDDAAARNIVQETAQDSVQETVENNVDEPPPAAPSPPDTVQTIGGTQDNVPKDDFPKQQAKPPVDIPQNVVPFPIAEPKSPTLTPVESNAFDELARRLSARLEGEVASETAPGTTAPPDSLAGDAAIPEIENPSRMETEYPAAFTSREPAPPRANSAQDTLLLDRLPVGVLVYRLDRLIYANSAFLSSTGYDSLHTLAEAGGLDALTVEAGAGSASSTSETGTPVVIAATSESGPDKGQPVDARLFAITWDGEPAHALVFSGPRSEARPTPRTEPAAVVAPVAVQTEDTTQAEELATILDTSAEGIVIFDGEGRLQSCNRSAEALFGRNDTEIAALNLADLFAPESQRAVLDYVESIKTTSVASLLDHGRDMLGRVRDGGTIPLSMTIGRTRPGSERFFAIFRDLSQAKKNEGELMQARRQAERATSAKADILARISHEVRMPLNAIIGFSDVMIDERFGALGNERYVEYMKDIRASGQRVMAIIDDLLDLTRIESGKMELSFASQDLNSMVEQCVAVMQPQANRERIIIRTSLAHSLPTVKADARALRQIALNLIGNSIHLANAGGQVIVSTATTDFGDIVLRVRDTGPGLNDNEIAAAMAPFRTPGASDQTADGSVVNLSLTKALVEANRAQFHIKTAPHSGTLIEVVFSHASAIA